MERDEAIRLRIGRNVRRLRELRQLTQVQLAEMVGTNNDRHMGQIERGEVNVGLNYLAKIADSVSVDIAELFFNDQPSPDDPPGVIAIFVTPEELEQFDRTREVLARVKELARLANPSEAARTSSPGTTPPDEPVGPSDDN
jgi:transcriptional regulator with XRE-family HTH domain